MKQFNVFNWRSLLEVDTPPCVSISVNLCRHDDCSIKERLLALAAKAEDSLEKAFGVHEASKLNIEEKIRSFLGYQELPVAKSVEFLISPEVSGFASFEKYIPELALVGESFHLKPFIFNNWQRPVIGVFATQRNLDFYLLSNFEIQPLGSFSGFDDFLRFRHLGKQSIFVFAEIPWGSSQYEDAKNKARSKGYRIVDLGGHDRDKLLSELPMIAKAQYQFEELRFLRDAHDQKPYNSSGKVFDNLQKSNGIGTFASPVLDPFWNRVEGTQEDIELYENSTITSHEGVVDDLFEMALKKDMNTLCVDPRKWDLPIPFVFNKPHKPLKEEVA